MICLIEEESMDEEEDDDLDFGFGDNLTEENSVLIADLDWKPQTNFFDFNKDSFSADIVNRLKGITEEGFAREVELWQNEINELPLFNEKKIREELADWDLSIPVKEDFNFDNLLLAYHRQVEYRTRITQIYSIVYAHNELLNNAYKSLKEMAVRLTPGPKHDKDAIATFTVQPFLVASTIAKRCMTFLESVQKNIEFSATQLDRLMRERQSLARINQQYNSEGMSVLYGQNVENKVTGMRRKAEDVSIKLRNNRLPTNSD